jgi:signal transduction histidine kinase
VLANLVRNGIEANPGRRTRFSVALEARGTEVLVTVANDGVPVAREIAPRIFDPYISSKPGNQNMGLGLAIVKKIVIEHRGEIAYAEQDGHPQFAICLPRAFA